MSNNNNTHLRLLGTVWSDETATTLLGYVIIDTREQLPRMKTLTIAQTKNLLTSTEFENVSLDKGEIHSTECSMDRLPKYDQRGKVIANGGYMVVARITDDKGETRGFRLVSSRGEILNVAYETLMNQVDTNSIFLNNAKITTRGETKYISAIRSEFKEIQLGTKTDEKEKARPLAPVTHEETVITRTNTPEYHANYLRKVIEKVARKGLSKGDYALRSPKSKDYSIFYKEFLKPEYPELAQYARHDIGWTQVIGVMLLIAKGEPEVKYLYPYLREKSVYSKSNLRVVKSVRTRDSNSKRTDVYYKRLNLGLVSPELLDIVRKYDKNGDVYNVLSLYNRVYEGKLLNGEAVHRLSNDVTNNINSLVLRSFVSRLENEANKPSRSKQVEHFVYDTEELDYFSEDGVEKLGLTLNPERGGIKVNSPLYSPIKQNNLRSSGGVTIRYVFDGVDLTQDQISELTELGNCYGDFNIFRMLVDLQKYREQKNPDESKFAMLVNFYVYVLAVHNKSFAKATTLYLGLNKDIVFDINDVYQSTNRSDKLLYHSGLRFGTKAELVRGQSFSGVRTNYVPKNTKNGFTQTMEAVGESLTLPKNGIPRKSNMFSYWS